MRAAVHPDRRFVVRPAKGRGKGSPMSRRRIERLNEQLKREVVDILRNAVRDPRIGTVTVTAVETAPDLSSARLYVYAGEPAGDARDDLMKGLKAAAPFVRHELGQRLHIRRAPELLWAWDESFEHAQRIERLLAEVRPPEAVDDEGDAVE